MSIIEGCDLVKTSQFFNGYPYTNYHEMNLDWIVSQITNLSETMKNFVITNKIKFANPIEWDSTILYDESTIVLAPDGNSYISLKNVPAGISYTNTEYWERISNFNAQLEMMNMKTNFFVPELFGAKGDGVTDDTIAIQKMFDSMNDGDKCIFLSKKYVTSDSITISHNSIGISGGFSGYEYTSIIECKNKVPVFIVNGYGARFFNVQIQTAIDNYLSDSVGILFNFDRIDNVDCDGCVDGCNFLRLDNAIKCYGRNCVVRNCQISHCNIGVNLIKNVLVQTEQRGFFISDNEFHRIYTACVESNLDFNGRKNISISNNISMFGGVLFYGIGTGVVIKSNFQYNEYENAESGVVLLASNNASFAEISDNTFIAGTAQNVDGIRLVSGSGTFSNVLIKNNYIKDFTRKGIIVEKGSNIVITNNTVIASSDNGYQVNDGVLNSVVTCNNAISCNVLFEPSQIINKYNTWN